MGWPCFGRAGLPPAWRVSASSAPSMRRARGPACGAVAGWGWPAWGLGWRVGARPPWAGRCVGAGLLRRGVHLPPPVRCDDASEWRRMQQARRRMSCANSRSDPLKKNSDKCTFDPLLRAMHCVNPALPQPHVALKNRHRSGTTTSPESKQLL